MSNLNASFISENTIRQSSPNKAGLYIVTSFFFSYNFPGNWLWEKMALCQTKSGHFEQYCLLRLTVGQILPRLTGGFDTGMFCKTGALPLSYNPLPSTDKLLLTFLSTHNPVSYRLVYITNIEFQTW